MPHSSPVRRLAAVVLSCLLVAAAAGCTPRPATGSGTLEDFYEALAEGDLAAAAARTDRPEQAEKDLRLAWDAMGARSLEGEITSSKVTRGGAVSQVRQTWHLAGDRTWMHDTTVHMADPGSGWVVRWLPSVLHPQLGTNQHPAVRAIAAPRASVIGSDGAALLEPGVEHRVVLDRDAAGDVREPINRIATILEHELPADDPRYPDLDARKTAEAAASGKGPFSVVVLPEATPPGVLDQIRGIGGVTVNDEAAMVRPDPGFAPDIMSRVERLVGDDVAGADGWQVVAATVDGAALATLHRVDPEVRPAVRVSIHRGMQEAAQAAVDQRAEKEAMLVAIRPSTGEVLAVAQTAKADEKGDLALMGQFPPGSTFKIVTAAAGIDRRGLHPDSIVPCPGQMAIGPRVVTNYNGQGVGDTTLTSAFARSCNTTFADISHQLGPGELKDEAAEFGLGVDYSIPGLATLTGSISDGEDEAERIDAGYGQGHNLVSPFGMALASATVAHGSTPVPTLMPTEKTGVSEQPAPLPPETLDHLRTLMRSVVTSGTATGIAGRGEIYAKTGEAEYAGGSHSWFTGYRGDLAFATLIVGGGGSEYAVAITDSFLAGVDEAQAAADGAPAAGSAASGAPATPAG